MPVFYPPCLGLRVIPRLLGSRTRDHYLNCTTIPLYCYTVFFFPKNFRNLYLILFKKPKKHFSYVILGTNVSNAFICGVHADLKWTLSGSSAFMDQRVLCAVTRRIKNLLLQKQTESQGRINHTLISGLENQPKLSYLGNRK